MHNVAAVQVGQCLESAPENVLGVVHHQLQHGGVLPVLHQEVGEGTVAHLGQVALQVPTHAGHEVVAEVAGGTLGVLLTHHHCLEGEDVVVAQQRKDLHLHLTVMSRQRKCHTMNTLTVFSPIDEYSVVKISIMISGEKLPSLE